MSTDPRDIIRNIEEAEEVISQFGEPEVLSGEWFMQHSLMKQRDDLRGQLEAFQRSQLDLVVDGEPVTEETLDVGFLVGTLTALRDAIASVGQVFKGAVTTRGVIPGTLRDETAIRLVGTFAGSFGVALRGPQLPVQLSLEDATGASVFEESVDAVLRVLDASEAEDVEAAILESVAGLGSRSILHLKNLAKAVNQGGQVRTEIRWHPAQREEKRVTFSAREAFVLEEILSSTEVAEHTVEERGHLSGALLVGGRFEFVKEDDDVIRGRIDPAIIEALPDFFDRDCVVTLTVSEARSRVHADKKAETYTMVQIREL